MRLSLGCEISYDVLDTATLIFNIEAMRGGRQTVLSEQLELSPGVTADEKTAEESGNRYLRLTAPPGYLNVRYTAEIELDPLHRAPAFIAEVPVATLPIDTLPFLNASRYCPSDQLSRFAIRQFGNIAPGFGRVVEICNWINAEVDYQFGTSGRRHVFHPRRGLSRLRPSGHHLLPRTGHPGPLCQLLRLAAGTAGFPRGV